MFTNYRNLDIFYYICAQNAQCWERITKSNMKIQRYNRLKAAINRAQSGARFDFVECEQARTKFNICTITSRMTNKVQPSVEHLYEIARHLDVDVKDLLISTK